MKRRIVMWVVVGSLAGLSVATATSYVASTIILNSALSNYSPYSLASPSQQPLSVRVLNISRDVESALWPIAAMATAVYVYLLEGDLRGHDRSRGFDIMPPKAQS